MYIPKGPHESNSSLEPMMAKLYDAIMMTSSIGSIFRITGPLFREFTGYRWIPLTKASDVELWCFVRSARE